MSAPVIRRATVDDIASLIALRRTFTEEDGGGLPPRADFESAFADIVIDGLESGRWIVWIAEIDGIVVSHAFVGTIEKIPRPVSEHRAIGYLTNVYTRPEYRDRGFGAGVLDAVTSWAVDADVELLMVWPSEASVAHYQRHGFADRGEPLVWLHPGHRT